MERKERLQPDRDTIAKKLGEVMGRKKRGGKIVYTEFSVEEIAACAFCSSDTVKRWLAGRLDPSAVQMWEIAKLTNKPFSWFVGVPTDQEPAAEEVLVALAAFETRALEIREGLDRLLAALHGSVADAKLHNGRKMPARQRAVDTVKILNEIGQDSEIAGHDVGVGGEVPQDRRVGLPDRRRTAR